MAALQLAAVPPVVLAFLAVFLATLAAVAWWVARDADARGSTRPRVWGLAAGLTPIGLPYYLFSRARHRGFEDRRTPPTRLDRLLATWASAGLVALLVGSVLAPPDPFAQAYWYLVGFAALLPVAWLVVGR